MKKEQERSPRQTEFNLATINGEQVLLPHDDLYIPPNALKIFLESFEGPLDLLLYFIRKQNLDILDKVSSTPIVIPNSPGDIKSLERIIRILQKEKKSFS